MWLDAWWVATAHVLLAVAISLHILLRKRRPVSAVLWLAVIWFLPFIGALLYLSFGIDQVRRGGAERVVVEDLWASLHDGDPRSWRPAGTEVPPEHEAAHIMRDTDAAVRPFAVHAGVRAELLVDGDEAYPRMLDAIASARSSVYLQTFIFTPDRVGEAFREALEDRAAAGLDVRVLADRFGSSRGVWTGFFRRMSAAGVRAATITQANPLKGRFQINLRNHRKLLIVDGREAFMGGLNIDAKNERSEARPADRDYHLRLEGPIIRDLAYLFASDWYFATREDPEALAPLYADPIEPAGEGLAQVVPGGPERGGRNLEHAFFGAIVNARESIDIVTPYFVPDETLVDAIVYAALTGVAVRLILPARSNHWYTTWAARSLYTPLLEAGVRIYERPGTFIHAKALVADGVYAFLGSANLDYRSLHLNFELNLEIAERAFVRQLEVQLEREVERSTEVLLSEHEARSAPRRLVENFCFLFQPIL